MILLLGYTKDGDCKVLEKSDSMYNINQSYNNYQPQVGVVRVEVVRVGVSKDVKPKPKTRRKSN